MRNLGYCINFNLQLGASRNKHCPGRGASAGVACQDAVSVHRPLLLAPWPTGDLRSKSCVERALLVLRHWPTRDTPIFGCASFFSGGACSYGEAMALLCGCFGLSEFEHDCF